MKKHFKTVLLASLSLAIVSAVHGESYGDLIVGFTTQVGKDVIYDVGGLGSLTNGETWSATTLGISGGNYHWGVIGDASAAFQQLSNPSITNDTLWCTSASSSPTSIYTLNGNGAWQAPDTGINTLVAQLPGGAQNFGPNSGTTISVTINGQPNPNSWEAETIVGTLSTAFHNAYINPNVVGQATAFLYQANDTNSAPFPVGTFTLSSAGVLTFNVVSTNSVAPTAAFTAKSKAGFAPLSVVFTNTSTGTITNWLWSFGDGHTVTNTTSSSVTNIYTAPGNYTVTLKVTGPGGSSTNSMSNFIAASPVPVLSTIAVSGGKLIFGGINAPAGVQYRILSSTNIALPLASWTPVLTNTFSGNGSYSYTNSAATNAQTYFRLVSP